jgi:flagellar protein FliS
MGLNPYANHLEEQVHSASAVELICMLYDALAKSVEEARRCLAAGDRLGRARAVSRAQELLGELSGALDERKGGELARRLASLYAYMIERLNEANFRQADAPLGEVARLAGALAGAWREVVGREFSAQECSAPYATQGAYQGASVSFCG